MSEALQETAETLEDIMAPLRRALINVYFPEHDGPNVSRFFLENGRLPYITDDIKPWKYRGWLLAYVLMLSGAAGISDRWNYHLRTLEAGCLLAEPIPQIEFYNQKEPFRDMQKIVEQLGHDFGFGERALILFVDWLAWALGVEHEEPHSIKEETNEFLYRTFNAGPVLLHPCDYIGELLQEYRGRSSKWSGFFLTPHTICDLMTRMTMGDSGDVRASTVCEPACGTGRLLLHASNHSLRLYGQDIDPVCVKITKINGALYAPWLSFPLPASVFGEDAKVIPPPPAELPITPDPMPSLAAMRVDDHRQGSLFDLEES